MLTLALILCYLLGLSQLLVISRRYSLPELVGYSFLLGMATETVFLFLLDIVGIKYSQGILIGLNVAGIVALNGINYKGLLQLKSEFKLPKFELKDVNLPALFVFGFIAYLFYAVTVKNLFWPTAEHDAIGSFDKLGRIMAIEGKLKISLFDYKLEGAGGIYPPLYHGALAYVYIFGATMGKIVTTLFFLSLLTSFYGLLRNYVDATASMIFTFLLMITPEMFSHAALGLDNLPTTAYVAAGALATFTWLDKRDKKYLWIGALMMALCIWVRSDTIVFTAAALAIIGIDFLRNKDWKSTVAYGAIAVAPFIIWTVYLKLRIASSQGARFDTGIGYNAARMDMMIGYLKAYLFGGTYGKVDGGQLYGLSFLLFFLLLIINAGLIFKAGFKEVVVKHMNAVIFFFVALGLYFAVFYLINEKTQGAPMWSLMESSFKRGMFYFIPVALFYVATNYGSAWLFEKIEKFRLG